MRKVFFGEPLLFRADADPEAIIDTISKTVGEAPYDETEDPAHGLIYEVVWQVAEGGLVWYEHTYDLGGRLMASGPSADLVDEVMRSLPAVLPVVTADELHALLADPSASDRKQLLMQIGFWRPRAPRPAVITFLSTSLSQPDPLQRMAALDCAQRLEWPELLPLVEPMERDPDDIVRQRAEEVRRHLTDIAHNS